jgi:hypothetical protein
MLRFSLAAFCFALLLVVASVGRANDYYYDDGCNHGGLFGWRNYTAEERRQFPNCYGGYERYYGGFHANYFRNYPGDDDGLQNQRYGYGLGWAW